MNDARKVRGGKRLHRPAPVRSGTRRRLLFKALLGLGAGTVLYASVDVGAWRAYEAVEECWIRDRHELLVQIAPGAVGAASLDLEVRLADLRRRALEFRFLVLRDQTLLQGGIWQLTALPLSPAVHRELSGNSEYRRAQDRIRLLNDALRKHPSFDTLHRAQLRLWKTPQYREIHRRYTGKMQELQRTWAGSAWTGPASVAAGVAEEH
ncbi:MAG: hypothetical protein H7039_08310 [Bryobacteraceae bacterium]|nr:hypothetical protein [Bryobacteraceae bacterium]